MNFPSVPVQNNDFNPIPPSNINFGSSPSSTVTTQHTSSFPAIPDFPTPPSNTTSTGTADLHFPSPPGKLYFLSKTSHKFMYFKEMTMLVTPKIRSQILMN